MGAGLSYDGALTEGTFLGRRKRFFADVRLDDGTEVVAHCANTGSMKGLLAVGGRCRLSFHDNPKRKLAWSLEQLEVDGVWVMVNTARANRVVEAALLADAIPELSGYAELRRERPYGERSRIDFELTGEGGPPRRCKGAAPAGRRCLVEVKNVSLVQGRLARFPDAVTARGTRHVRELIAMAEAGVRAVLLAHIARDDVDAFEPAADIDPDYAAAMAEAAEAGVELLAWTCAVGTEGLALARPVDVRV